MLITIFSSNGVSWLMRVLTYRVLPLDKETICPKTDKLNSWHCNFFFFFYNNALYVLWIIYVNQIRYHKVLSNFRLTIWFEF